ncbi:MAG: hypothetical protein M0R80_00910 [Proteobacteria bacterium]|jgi:hypothetical protein|nr:hypothetical protein [Pseudomonadota bacterium]
MRIGGRDLLNKYGTALAVAEALLRGELNSNEEQFVEDVVSPTIMQAAVLRQSITVTQQVSGLLPRQPMQLPRQTKLLEAKVIR